MLKRKTRSSDWKHEAKQARLVEDETLAVLLNCFKSYFDPTLKFGPNSELTLRLVCKDWHAVFEKEINKKLLRLARKDLERPAKIFIPCSLQLPGIPTLRFYDLLGRLQWLVEKDYLVPGEVKSLLLDATKRDLPNDGVATGMLTRAAPFLFGSNLGEIADFNWATLSPWQLLCDDRVKPPIIDPTTALQSGLVFFLKAHSSDMPPALFVRVLATARRLRLLPDGELGRIPFLMACSGMPITRIKSVIKLVQSGGRGYKSWTGLNFMHSVSAFNCVASDAASHGFFSFTSDSFTLAYLEEAEVIFPRFKLLFVKACIWRWRSDNPEFNDRELSILLTLFNEIAIKGEARTMSHRTRSRVITILMEAAVRTPDCLSLMGEWMENLKGLMCYDLHRFLKHSLEHSEINWALECMIRRKDIEPQLIGATILRILEKRRRLSPFFPQEDFSFIVKFMDILNKKWPKEDVYVLAMSQIRCSSNHLQLMRMVMPTVLLTDELLRRAAGANQNFPLMIVAYAEGVKICDLSDQFVQFNKDSYRLHRFSSSPRVRDYMCLAKAKDADEKRSKSLKIPYEEFRLRVRDRLKDRL